MASIGAYTVIDVQGGINPGTGDQLEEITRPGVNGVAYRKLGKRGLPFQLRVLVDAANAAGARTKIINFKAMQGTSVTIVDNDGNSWPNAVALNVRHLRTQKIENAVGAVDGGEYLLSFGITFQMTDTTL